MRDYAPGDSFNRIHWPSTARTGRLISKEFELDPTADVWLFLDLERGGQAELLWADVGRQAEPRLPWEPGPDLTLMPSTVEYGVTIIASLAKHFIARDRAVGFIAYSHHREVIPADRGERQLTKILETLAVDPRRGPHPPGRDRCCRGRPPEAQHDGHHRHLDRSALLDRRRPRHQPARCQGRCRAHRSP